MVGYYLKNYICIYPEIEGQVSMLLKLNCCVCLINCPSLGTLIWNVKSEIIQETWFQWFYWGNWVH